MPRDVKPILSASPIRVTEPQAEALHRLLALLKQQADVASTGEPIHWLEVTTEAQVWTIDDRGRVVGWNDREVSDAR